MRRSKLCDGKVALKRLRIRCLTFDWLKQNCPKHS